MRRQASGWQVAKVVANFGTSRQKWLWVQDEIAAHRLEVCKVPMEENPADVATKYHPAPRTRTLSVLLSLKLVEAHDKADARFLNSAQVSTWKLVLTKALPGRKIREWSEHTLNRGG